LRALQERNRLKARRLNLRLVMLHDAMDQAAVREKSHDNLLEAGDRLLDLLAEKLGVEI